MRFPITRSPAALARLAVVVLAALAACHDAAGPHRSVDVSVAVTAVRGPYLGLDSLGNPTIACDVDFAASAVGTDTAWWTDATYRFYYGKSRRTPDAVYTLPDSEIVRGWNSGSIADGPTEHTTWYFYGGIPFSGEFEFHYTEGADTVRKSATARFTCGPEVSDSTPPPVLDTVTMVPPSGVLPAGAPLTVSWAASSPVGLWESAMQVTGPCVVRKVFSEQLQHDVAREISLPMDTTCLHDTPVYLHVAVVDAAAQGVEEIIASPLVIEDRAPLDGGPLLLPTRVPELQALGAAQLEPITTPRRFHVADPRPGRPRVAR